MKNKLRIISKIGVSLVLAVMLFAAIAAGNQTAETNSYCEGGRCKKKCEQTYQKAVKSCEQKYKGDPSMISICENTANTAKNTCETNCETQP